MACHWLVTGCSGQLGTALVGQLERDGEPCDALPHAELDISDAAAVEDRLARIAPDVVVNAGAFTHVDRCESEPELARRGNAEGPAILAAACASRGTRLVHVSTDYVFAGDARRPYRETDPVAPRSTYGRTKLEGERAVLRASPDFLVVRTSWLFGHGRNFIGAILGQAEARRQGRVSGPLRVVDDQTGSPTYAEDLAVGIRGLLAAGARGLYHLSNRDVASWWDLARFCLDETGHADLPIERIHTRDLDLPAPRPAWSVLDCSKAEALGVGLRGWREAVRAYLQTLSVASEEAD